MVCPSPLMSTSKLALYTNSRYHTTTFAAFAPGRRHLSIRQDFRPIVSLFAPTILVVRPLPTSSSISLRRLISRSHTASAVDAYPGGLCRFCRHDQGSAHGYYAGFPLCLFNNGIHRQNPLTPISPDGLNLDYMHLEVRGVISRIQLVLYQ